MISPVNFKLVKYTMEKSQKWISIEDLWGFKSTFYKLFNQPPKTSCFLWLLCLFYREDVKSNRGKSLTGLGTAEVDGIESWIFTVFDRQLEGLGSVYIGHIFWSNIILLHILWVTHGNSKETYNKPWEVIKCCLSIFVLPLFFLNHSVLCPMGLFLTPILCILVEYGGIQKKTH